MTFPWISAVASLAMMLAVQTLHSPLQHVLECAGENCPHRHSEDDSRHASHHHQAAHSHRHSSTDPTVPVADHSSDSSSSEGSSFPENSGHSDCVICQFLAQSVHPILLPVLLCGVEVVSIPRIDLLPIAVALPLAGPYVRGPPPCSLLLNFCQRRCAV